MLTHDKSYKIPPLYLSLFMEDMKTSIHSALSGLKMYTPEIASMLEHTFRTLDKNVETVLTCHAEGKSIPFRYDLLRIYLDDLNHGSDAYVVVELKILEGEVFLDAYCNQSSGVLSGERTMLRAQALLALGCALSGITYTFDKQGSFYAEKGDTL